MGKIRISTLLLFFCCAFFTTSNAQSTLTKANKQYDLHAYNLATKSYLEVLERQPGNMEALVKVADCYYMLNRLDDSRIYYEQAVNQGPVSPEVYLKYGQSLKGIGQYELARLQFLKYAETHPVDGQQFARSCEFALARINESPSYVVKAEYLNTPASDFSPVFYGTDQVVYSSARSDMKRPRGSSSSWIGTSNNQLFITARDNNGYLQSPAFLRSDLRNLYNEGPIAYSPDKKWVAITKNNFVDGTRQIPESGVELSIYLAEVKENGDWEDPVPFQHNGSGYSTGYPCFSPDGNALYFSSDRPDGFGGYDVYVSYRNGKSWTPPENLGAIVNSIGNEITPFFDGTELFFASDWHQGFGGYDIFRSNRGSGERFTILEHAGTEINSPRDDFGFVFDEASNFGYLTSNRVGGQGSEDIYRVKKKADQLVIQVVNGSDLTPIEGAVVDFSSCGEGTYTSDNTGIVRVNARQGINCQAEIRKYGYISGNLNITTTGLSPNRNMEVILTRIGEDYLGAVVNLLSGYQVENVNVRAINQASGATMEATTNMRGEYSLALRPNTSYIIRYSKSGFVDVNRTIKTGDGLDRSIMGTISLTPSGAIQNREEPIAAMPKGGSDIPVEYNAEVPIPVSSIVYSIQVAAIPTNRTLDLDNYERKLGEISTVYYKTEGSNNKVRIGPFLSREEANSVLPVVKSKGYTSAFIVKETPPQTSPKGSNLTPKGMASDFNATAAIPAPGTPDMVNPYFIQLAAYSNTNFFDPSKVSDLGQLENHKRGGLTVYYLGGYPSQEEAEKTLAVARKRGFSGAYLIKKADGKFGRIPN
ncbi:MAG: SPOR domain-containing protein [Saprospiraceae bacterium]|nr:SPOR domain-containing protein [Saprospiraceae bacterium]